MGNTYRPHYEMPERFAHYRVTGVIGKGGMALVYAATNERTGAEVALKVVDDAARSGEARARFEHEASIAGKLEHPNIVRVYDFLDEPSGPPGLVMERLRGETLASLLARRGTLTLLETIAIVLPLLAALDHTHRQGVVHRDVKPSNVFLAKGEDGEVFAKLLDFGIATRPLSSPQLTADDEVLGTPRAMSPEQIRGDAVLDGRSDLFSIASTFVEVMTAVPPFDAKTAAASLVAVLEREVDPPPEIPPRVFVELSRALRKRPFERHATAGELASALRAAAGSPSNDDLRAALKGLAPVEASVASAVSDTPRVAPVERRRRPNGARRYVAPILVALGAVLAILGFVVGSKVGPPGADTMPSPSASHDGPAPALEPRPSATTAQASTTVAAASAPSASPVVPPTLRSSTAPKGSAKPKTKPVATRPDF